MTLLADTLFPAADRRRTAVSLLMWWESRRLLYNIAVGITGLAGIAAMQVSAWLPPSIHTSFSWGPVIAFALMANVCYTFGWLIEMAAQRLWRERVAPLGPPLFRQGLIFSVGLTALPIIIAGVSWVGRVAAHLIA